MLVMVPAIVTIYYFFMGDVDLHGETSRVHVCQGARLHHDAHLAHAASSREYAYVYPPQINCARRWCWTCHWRP